MTTDERAPRFRLASWESAVLTLILLWGAWLRVRQVGESLWLDELHTAWAALAPWSEIGERAAIGNQSPFYFYLAGLLARLLGASEWVLRLPSLVAGCALPVALWWFVCRLADERGDAEPTDGWRLSALLAAWLVAVEPTAIFYAQEARPYALVQLLAVLHVGLLLESLRSPAVWKEALWVGLAAVLFYLHYTAGLLLAAEGAVVWVLWWRGDAVVRWGRVAVWLGMLVVVMAPAAFQLGEIYARRRNWELFVPRVGWRQLANVPWMIPWSGAALYALVGLATRRSERSLVWPLLLVWLLVPVGLVGATSSLDWLRLWHVRYVIGATPAALLLAACLPQWIGGRGKLVVVIGFALGAAGMSHLLLDWSSAGGFSQRNEDWRGAAEYLREQSAEGGLVLLRSGLIEADALRVSDSAALRDYCDLPLTALYRLPPEVEIMPLPTTNSGQLTASTGRRLAEQGGGWLVVRGSLATAEQIAKQLAREEAAAGRPVRIGSRRSFGRVQVMQLRLTQARSASEGNTAVWRMNDAPNGTLIPSLALRACMARQPPVAFRSR